MKKIRVLSIAVIALLFAFAGCSQESTESSSKPAPSEPEKQVFQWRLHQNIPPGDASQRCHTKFVEMIEANTNGQIKIKILPAGSVVGAKELLSACGSGQIEMMVGHPAWWSGTIPAGAVEGGLPFSYKSQAEQYEVALDYGLEDLMREEYKKHGAYLLTEYATGLGQGGICLVDPINSLDDLKGRKIRGYGVTLELLKRLGTSPMTMPVSEIYMALSTGTVKGSLSAWEAMISQKLYEPCKYGIQPSLYSADSMHIMVNLDVWNALPKDLQTIVQLTAHEWSYWELRYYSPRNFAGAIERLQKQGMSFITLSEEDQAKLLTLARGVWDDLASKDQLAAKAIKMMTDYFKEKGRPGF